MKFLFPFLLFIASAFHTSFGQKLRQEYQTKINIFIGHVINNNSKEIAKMISYPLKRDYPIPDIKTKEDFILRYDEIFDDSLKNLIIDSDAATDWSEMGWRGIMLNRGEVWMDTEGKIIAINYQSSLEKTKQKNIIKADKKKLYPTLTEFKNPEYVLETAKFRIRIDQLNNGKYRYASWPISKPMSEKPDLILTNGEVFMDGSGGNHHFEFKNGIYTYQCFIWRLRGSDTSPADLSVLKNEVEILSQSAVIVE
ncbi:hypothetical protein [uncultured Cytophaga sp.]|uniref:hypothetical protein n=1 Tax=uncultured Cytophaga sp. TaxID=160238 RepID=UPI002631EDD5|nr:hypothetical protein [uncultured Cytophaga sp.]